MGRRTSSTPVVCTTTDSTGAYVFHDLLPGGYAMTETDPAGVASTTPNTIGTALVVSQGTGISDNNDFGDGASASYTITKTLTTANPTRPGQPVTFEIAIMNTGSSWIPFCRCRISMTARSYCATVEQFATPRPDNDTNDGVHQLERT